MYRGIPLSASSFLMCINKYVYLALGHEIKLALFQNESKKIRKTKYSIYLDTNCG